MVPNNSWENEEIKGEIKKLKTNENKNMIYQKLWDAAKTVLRGKFRAEKAYLKKKEKSQSNLTSKGTKKAANKSQETKKTTGKKSMKLRACPLKI